MRPTLSTTTRVGACGPADAEVVWRRYAVPSRWSTWSPQVRGVTCESPDEPVRAGTRGVVHGPAGLRVPFEVTEVDEERRRWTWRVRLGPLDLAMTHGVGTRRDGRCCVWVGITGPLPLVAAYAPVARLALRRLVDGTGA